MKPKAQSQPVHKYRAHFRTLEAFAKQMDLIAFHEALPSLQPLAMEAGIFAPGKSLHELEMQVLLKKLELDLLLNSKNKLQEEAAAAERSGNPSSAQQAQGLKRMAAELGQVLLKKTELEWSHW